MKRNHRNNKIWLSILLIVALLTPMLPSFALAEGEGDNGLSVDESVQMMAAAEADEAAAAEAAAQAAAEEAARKAAEEEAARQAAAQAAAEEAARKAAEEEAARKAAEQAAAEEAARKAAEEEAARKAAEQAAAEEAARKAAEEEAARQAAEQAAAEEAARKAEEEAARQAEAEAEEKTDGEEATAAPEVTEQPTEAPTAEPTPAPIVAAAPVVQVATEPMMDVTDTKTIVRYDPSQTLYYVTEKPSEDKLTSVLPDKLPAIIGETQKEDVEVTWSYKDSDASKTSGDFVINYTVADEGYAEAEDIEKPTVTLCVVVSDEFTFELDTKNSVVTITGWKKDNESTMNVPAEISGLPVTAIADKAFNGKTKLQTAELPDGLKKIGDEAFKDCTALKQVIFPDSLTEVGKDVFDATNSVETVKLIVNNETTLKTADSFVPTAKADDSSAVVKLPKAITDIEVQAKSDKAGSLTISTEYTVANGHGIATMTDGDSKGAIINGATIVNHGRIVNNGTFTNNGQVYSCDAVSEVSDNIEGNAVVKTHTYADGYTKCTYCNYEKLVIQESHVTGVTDKEYTGSDISHEIVVVVDQKRLKEDTDFTVSYSGRKNVTEKAHTVTITGINDYTGEVKKTFYITPKSISGATVDAITAQTYTGSEIKPSVTVKDGTNTLRENTDYTLSYSDNVGAGTATITINGIGNYKETKSANFLINAVPVANVTLTGIATKTYTGSAITQSDLALTYNGMTLTAGTDYSVTYSNNTDAGTATVTIAGQGNYAGSRTETFTIGKASREVKIALKSGHTADKVYDATRNLSLSSKDFEITNVASGDKVSLSKITGSYSKRDVGTYKISLGFEINQTSTNYTYKISGITVNGTINPKPLTIRPGVEKSATDKTLVSQTKVFGTADPSSYKAKIGRTDGTGGIYKGDEIADAVSGKLSRESGENVGKYKITIGTLKGKGNYAAPIDLETGYFEITPKSVNATDVGMVALGNQKYTGSAVEPAITLKYGTRTLVKGTDYEVKYTNNVEPGTATVTITGKGNYNGTRTATFRILKVSTASTTGSSTSTGSSGSSGSSGVSGSSSVSSGSSGGSTGYSSASGGGEGDEADEEELRHQYDELMAWDDEDLNELADSLDIDPDEYDSKEALVRAIIAAEREDDIGELVLDGQPYGTILFGADDAARPFLIYEEVIEPETPEDETDDELFDLEEDEDDEALEEEEEEPLKKRLRIEALNLQDEEGNDLFLDEEETREKYEQLYLRLTPNQIDGLKANDFVELIYELENAELHIALDELTREIDATPFEKPERPEYVEPATAVNDPELYQSEDEDGEPVELVEVDELDDTVLETLGVEMNPNMVSVDQYEFHIDQVVEESLTLREQTALEGKEAFYPYRIYVDAIHGEVKENVTEAIEPDSEALDEAPDADQPELKRYPMLGVLKQAELRIIMDEDPTEETEQLFVSDDEAIREDADAIEFRPVNYVEDEEMSYASFEPEHSGLYTVVEEIDEDDEDFERIPYGVTYGPVNTPVPTPSPEPTATPTPAPTPEPTPEPEPEVIEDPDPSYAYSRRSNEGNQYWLVDTVNKTVEYFSEIDSEYWIGDYTGSLMSGMDVKTRTGDKTVNIQLKFQQTYKFALMNGDGPELLMEQDDVANVDAQLSAHR